MIQNQIHMEPDRLDDDSDDDEHAMDLDSDMVSLLGFEFIIF